MARVRTVEQGYYKTIILEEGRVAPPIKAANSKQLASYLKLLLLHQSDLATLASDQPVRIWDDFKPSFRADNVSKTCSVLPVASSSTMCATVLFESQWEEEHYQLLLGQRFILETICCRTKRVQRFSVAAKT